MSRRKIGRYRYRLAELLTEYGLLVHAEDIGIQEGAYRSHHWDLARWFVDATWIGNPKGLRDSIAGEPHIGQKVHLASWDTVTDCVRYGISMYHPAPYPSGGWDEAEVCRG